MNWTKMTDNFANYSGYQKSVILGEDILVYTSNTTAYKSSGDVINKGRSWTQVSVTGLPENIKLSSSLLLVKNCMPQTVRKYMFLQMGHHGVLQPI